MYPSIKEFEEIASVVDGYVISPNLKEQYRKHPDPAQELHFALSIPRNFEISKAKLFETEAYKGLSIPREEDVIRIVLDLIINFLAILIKPQNSRGRILVKRDYCNLF